MASLASGADKGIRSLLRSPFALALASCLLVACSQEERNLLLIVSDTLRADALSCYGGKARTPNLCALAERGVLFENAYANAPWTLPSSVAMFTGNYPSEYARKRRNREVYYYVGDEEVLLAEGLRDAGYETLSFLGTQIAGTSNTLQGFESGPIDPSDPGALLLSEPRIEVGERGYRYRMVFGALRFLLHRRPDSPFYLLLWLQDPHAPYRPSKRGYRSIPPLAASLPQPLEFYLGLGHIEDPGRGLAKLKREVGELSRHEVAFLKTLYLKEVEFVDERLGHVLRALELRELEDETFVVFTSDHGEGFGEHGLFLHGNSLYDELVRVPLIVAGPGIARRRRVSTRVSHVDLMPTLVELMDVESLRQPQGRSFAALLRGDAEPEEESHHYLMNPSASGRMEAVIHGRYKLVSLGDGNESMRLYDITADPEERTDVSAAHPEATDRLRARLEALRRDVAGRRARNLEFTDHQAVEEASRDTEAQLRALGYID